MYFIILNDEFSFENALIRYVYVPEEENSSKSVEIERIMREARLRELVKGVYSSTFGDSVTAKVIKIYKTYIFSRAILAKNVY